MAHQHPLPLAVFMLAISSAQGCGGDEGGDESPSSTSDTQGDDSPTSETEAPGSSESGPASTESEGSEDSSSEDDSEDTSTETEGGDEGVKFDLIAAPDSADMGEELADPALWYSAHDFLFYIEIDPTDGSAVTLVQHELTSADPVSNAGGGLTMLLDGSLLLARGPQSGPGGDYFADSSAIYYANVDALPTTEPGVVEFELLGKLPDNTAVEALHVGCDDSVYLMDSGTNSANIDGNRLLRFTGDYLQGELEYEVITDLGMAEVADIDDMSPGIGLMGEITDSQGFGIDSGTVYDLNYLDGTGVPLGMAGTFGVHALGGPFFDDDLARLYVMDIDAALFELDPLTLESSDALVIGPDIPGSPWKVNPGLAGPLSACESGFPPPA